MAATFDCQAVEYFFEPKFSSNQRYDTNLYMRRRPFQNNWISTLSPGINFGLRHENGQLNSNFTWNQLLYNNQSELDIDEQLFGINYQHQHNERLQWGANGSYNSQSSLNTEESGSGLLFTQVMRKQLSIAPTVSYSLDELSSVALDYSYDKATYEKNQNIFFLSDYDYHQATGTYNYIYSELDRLNFSLSSSLYKTPVQNQRTFNHVAQAGWQHTFDKQITTYISAGLNYSQIETTLPQLPFIGFTSTGQPVYFDNELNQLTLQQRYAVVKSNNFGQVYRASIQKTFERGSVSLIGSQNQTPTSQGLQTRSEIAFSNSISLNERWTAAINASYSSSEITGQTNSQFNRTNYSISPSINWKWTPEINLGLSYRFRQQEYQSSPEPSLGNVVQLQFNYQPQINRQVK
ncbi:MAG: hypothetical protein ABL919_00845 [Methylococcales bacterium]|nr:hypothetical protein [Methylococcaceae bacterium]